MKRLLLLALLVGAPLRAQNLTPPWHHPLYLDNGGYWPNRLKITVNSAAALDGAPQTLVVGENGLNLAGGQARSLRVLNDSGRELLFNLSAADGSPRHEGLIANGDRLTVPVEIAPNQTRALWIYWGNDKAGLVPDFLPGGFANGGAESGTDAPLGWQAQGADNEHLLRWVEGGHSGKKALYAEAKPGAASDWFKWWQGGVPVAPGQQVEVRAWVKGENVVGSAGLYVHVHGAKPQLINQTLKAGDGTFDWKEVTAKLTVPDTGATMDIGTVLYGTGKAWFDDVTLKISGTETGAAKLEVGPVETMALTMNRPKEIVYEKVSPPHDAEIPLNVFNLTSTDKPGALITADLRRALFVSRLGDAPHWRIVGERGGSFPARLDKGALTFQADLPAHTITAFRVLLSQKDTLPPSSSLPDSALAEGPVNRLQNGSFEQGGDLPDGWELSAQKADGKPVGTARRVRGGKDGEWAVELTIPPDANPNWSGWHQTVPVESGAKYLVGVWIKTRDSGGAQLHAHLLDADKKLTKENAFQSAGPAVSGTTDWTWLQTIVTAPADASFIELHLTTNTTGTVWHDGVVVRQLKETLPASVGPLHSTERDLAVWQASPALKIFKDDAIRPDAKSCEISLARNEREPLQLVLRSATARAVKVSVSALKNAAGATLPLEITRVGYVPVDYPTNYYRLDTAKAWERKIPTSAPGCDGWPGDWPDPLYPIKSGDSVPLNAGDAQPLYFTVHAPEAAAPGVYKSEITIGERRIPLTVRVRDFALPKVPSLQITFDCRGPKVPNAESWYRFLAEHDISPGIIADPQFRLENGAVQADFSAFDKAATLCFDELGMSTMYTPGQFYALGWAYSPKDFLGTKAFTPEWDNAFGSALRQFTAHIKAKGWLNKFTFYLSDEPFSTPEVAANLQKFSQFVQKNAPGLPVYSSTWSHMKALDGAVTRWGAGHVGMFPVADIKERQAAGDSFWFTTDGQQCLDTPYLGTERLLSWYCYKYGIQGFEFWGVNWWTYDPHQFGWHAFISQADSEKSAGYYVRYPNGDGYLTYPSPSGPLSSIRLEAVRDGAEDYEYLRLLQQRVARAKAAGKPVGAGEALLQQAEAQVTIPNAGGRYSSKNQSDPTAILRLRDQIGDAIEALR